MADKFGNVVGGSIPIYDDEEEVDAIAAKIKDNKPEAYVVYLNTNEVRDETNIERVNSVISCDILLYYRVKDVHGRENTRIEDEITLKNIVLNALMTDRTRGSNATTLVVEDEAIYGTEVEEITTEEIAAPFYKMKIPVRCSFQHTETGR